MKSRLFPGSVREPKTAYTFTVMKQSALHHLESKRSCYDYLGALLRLTDNSFTADVPVSHGHISVGVLLT